MTKARGRAIAAMMVVAATSFHLRASLWRGEVFYERDIHLQWYGQVRSFIRCLAEQSWPVWDPWVSFGQPLLANANNQLLYPFTWLHLIMQPWTYYTVFLFAHLAAAGFGAYALTAALGASFEAAVAAGLLFTLSGPLLSLGNLWNHLAAVAWMPWILVAAHRLGTRPGWPRALLLSLAVAAQILTGSPDMTAFTLGLALVMAALGSPEGAPAIRVVAWGGLALALALALAAGQFVPTVALAAQSGRLALDVGARSFWSTDPRVLLLSILPVSWDAVPFTGEWRQRLFEGREPLLFSLYCGLPTMVLACCGEGGRRHTRHALQASAVLFALFALGTRTPVYTLASALVPGVSGLRFPSKALVPATLCLCLAAGLGIDGWAACRTRARAAVLAGLAAVCLLFAWSTHHPGPSLASAVGGTLSAASLALWPLTTALALTALIALGLAALSLAPGRIPPLIVAAVGILLAGWRAEGLNPTAPPAFFTTPSPVVRSLDQRDLRRLYVYDYSVGKGRSRRLLDRDDPFLPTALTRVGPFPWVGALALRLYLLPPISAGFGVLDSYSIDGLGIQDPGVRALSELMLNLDGTWLQRRLLQMGAVSQVLALHEPAMAGLLASSEIPSPFSDPMRLGRLPHPLARAYVVSGVAVARGSAALGTLSDPAFVPERDVLLETGQARPADPSFDGNVRVVRFAPDAIDLDVESNNRGYVVIVDAYDPGWTATVDGASTPVLRANSAFRAVAVEAGRHRLSLRYRPWPVIVGLGLTLASLLGVAIVEGARHYRRGGLRPSGSDPAIT